MRNFFIAWCVLLMCSVGKAQEAVPTQSVPPHNRLPEKPLWELDVTDKLQLSSGVPYAEAMGRTARSARAKGSVLSWRLALIRPRQADPTWPVVLEADESRVFTSVNSEGIGTGLNWNRRESGDAWYGGEGSFVVPFGDDGAATLSLKSLDNPLAYPNGFGRLRLRPATADETIRFERDLDGKSITIKNLTDSLMKVVWHARHEDYFGINLGSADEQVVIAPRETVSILVPPCTAKDFYKTRYWASIGEHATLQYWMYRRSEQEPRERTYRSKIAGGLDWVFVSGPVDKNPAPLTGWQHTEKDSFSPTKEQYKTHWMWIRKNFTVPGDWPADCRFQLALGSVRQQARVMLDGQLLCDVANWDLPTTVALPENVRPASSHELLIGVTDYSVGLAPGIKPPGGGEGMTPVRRGVAAPIPAATGGSGDLWIMYGLGPTLLAVPIINTKWAAIRTTFKDSKKISATLELENMGYLAENVTIKATVMDAGKTVLQFGQIQATISGRGTKQVVISNDWTDCISWTPETPKLYELRIELSNASGKVFDTRRERFGFREFGIEGDHFTLNGQRINLFGGSHMFPRDNIWPVRAHPYRLLRYVNDLDIADETGFFLKDETTNMCSWGGDNYAWEIPAIWERLLKQNINKARSRINHPALIMYDVANEVAFRGPGEAEKMGNLFKSMRQFDPTRLITIGGSHPIPAGAELIDYHGWCTWKNRSDYWFMHPEERPSYLKKTGYYSRWPTEEMKETWVTDLNEIGSPQQLFPGNAKDLRHIGNLPSLFSESMYMEDIDTFPLNGHDTYLALPQPENPNGAQIEASFRALNLLGGRRLAVQNIRQAGFASGMIHVAGGTGRYLFPLASFSWDRKFRFNSGEPMLTRFAIHDDRSVTTEVEATYSLYDADKLLARKSVILNNRPGTISFVDLDFPLPATNVDKTVRLDVRLAPLKGGGEFFDSVPITIFAPFFPKLPEGAQIAVFDPQSKITPRMEGWKIPFIRLDKLSDWIPARTALIAGPESLTALKPEELLGLQKAIASGGNAIVLQHFTLPTFLARNLVQNSEALNQVARLDNPSVVTNGLLTEDFRSWTTHENDQVVAWNPLETPSSGHFLAHLNSGRNAPVLELGEGTGRVLFVQLNLQDAVGLDPAATKVFSNLLKWTASPSPFVSKPTLLVAADKTFLNLLQSRTGLEATCRERPSSADVANASLIILSGTDKAARDALYAQRDMLLRQLNSGTTLFVYNLDESGCDWLSNIAGSTIKLSEQPFSFAYLARPDSDLVAGLGHGDFFINGIKANLRKTVSDISKATGRFVVNGEKVIPLTQPAYLTEISVGKGRIAIDLVRSLESPQPSQARVLAMFLSNSGARLDPEGTSDNTIWKFQPLNLTPYVNHSLRDNNDPTKPRGWNCTGEENDLREFPTGRQMLRGVAYEITRPEAGQGNSIVMVSGKDPKFPAPTVVKGISVNAKAERLYFLHNSAWGIPEFTYRVYYSPDRKEWIPGKPDPYVDVVVRPNEGISEWVFAGAIDRKEKFLPGARVAWLGGTDVTRKASPTGAKDVGVYEMVWDNPHPDKTIDSIDIISSGMRGNGIAFIFGITAATRDTASLPSKDLSVRNPISTVLPQGSKEPNVHIQVDFPTYGFVIMRDGSIGAIYSAEGQTFAQTWGWKASFFRDIPGMPKHEKVLGRQSDSVANIKETTVGKRRTFEISGDTSAGTWKVNIAATPSKIRYDSTFTPKQNAPEGQKGIITSGVMFLNNTKAKVGINKNPFPIETPSGQAWFAFDQPHTVWVYNYELSPTSITMKSPCHKCQSLRSRS